MKIPNELIETIVEVAVVKALNKGRAAFNIPCTAEGLNAAKDELKLLVTAVACDNGTLILALDAMEADMVGPLYCVFSAAWAIEQVRESVLERMREYHILKGETFDLRMQLC